MKLSDDELAVLIRLRDKLAVTKFHEDDLRAEYDALAKVIDSHGCTVDSGIVEKHGQQWKLEDGELYILEQRFVKGPLDQDVESVNKAIDIYIEGLINHFISGQSKQGECTVY